MVANRDDVDTAARRYGCQVSEKIYNLIVAKNFTCPCRAGVACPCAYAEGEIAARGRCKCGLLYKETK